MKLKSFTALFLTMLLATACGDDVNNYYTNESEKPAGDNSFTPGKWMTDAASLCWFGIENSVLYPCWLLQADAVKRAYSDSEFARQFFTDDMAVSMLNPGAGTRITIIMDESPVNSASEYSMTVPDSLTGAILSLQYPVEWNIESLLGWDTDKMVELKWTVLLDGKKADRFTKKFNCRSLNNYYYTLLINKITEKDEYDEIVKMDFGSYPIKESEDMLYTHLTPFLMGYVDEHSPLIERLKNEVIKDGYLDALNGNASATIEKLLNSSARAFSYLLMKYQINYVPSPTSGTYFMRSFDDIFSNRHVYNHDIAIAFASWCYNQNIPIDMEVNCGRFLNHIVDWNGMTHAIDIVTTAMWMPNFPKIPDYPTAADFENADHVYEDMMPLCQDRNATFSPPPASL